MGIQEIMAYVGPKPGAGQRASVGSKESGDRYQREKADFVVISTKAKALYENGETQKFDVIRERVRLGYYLKGEILDHVVSALAREFSVENPSQASGSVS
jgi:hypothetical protein